MAIRIPVHACQPIGDVDFVFVYNEEMIRMTWALGASISELRCKVFSSIDELLVAAESISKNVPIFLDSNLGQGIRGQDFAQILREMGFRKIFLATSYAELHGTKIDHIDAVVGKSFEGALTFLREANFRASAEVSV